VATPWATLACVTRHRTHPPSSPETPADRPADTSSAAVTGRESDQTDAQDAELLCRLLRLDEIVEVAVPDVEQEAARDLVREPVYMLH
jgi:hypothetical protein